MSGHVWLDSWSLAVSPVPQKQPQSGKQTPTTTHYHSLLLSGKSCFHQNMGLLPFHDTSMVLTSPFFLSDTHGIGGSLTNVVKPSKKHWVNLPSAPSGVYLDGNSAGPSEDTHYGRPFFASPIVNLIPQHHSASIPRSKPLLWGILVY